MRNVWVHRPCLFFLFLQVFQATHFSMLLNVLNVFSYVPRVLGSHGFMVLMVSFVLFVSTLVALTSDVVLTNAKGGFHRKDGKDEIQRKRKGEDEEERSPESTPRGFEPLRAEPNGFRVHLLNRSDTVSW